MDVRGKERGILKPRVVIETPKAVLTPQGSCDHAPVSPQPSVDRLSVTWADPGSMSSSGVNLFHLPSETPVSNEVKFSPSGGDGSDDEDYSVSLSAVLRQRRASVRRSRKGRARRPSSPFLADEGRPRRRSSVFTTSSGDTAISIEDGQPAVVTQEQIFENIHLHKEVLGSVKQQPLGMRRKLKIVHQAKAYIKRHEGQLQERLAQSKCTKDIYARFNILVNSKWQQLKREAANTSNLLIPWELRIKEIESHFGSVVASYFTFLRWLFWVNLVVGFILLVFVIVPEYLTANPQQDGERKVIMEEERFNATKLLTLWEFEGILKCSPIFYGYYSNVENVQYGMPLAYFLTGLAVYIYSFVAILRKMAENSRMSKLSEKEDECIFSWKLFTGWDFMIGNTETAHNRIASVILSFKEALLEEAEKKKDLRNWRIMSLRAVVNICVVILLAVSAYAVVTVVSRSDDEDAHKVRSWWRENETTIVVTVISITFPVFFELLGFLEHYHPRKQLRLQLARIMLLNLLNLYSLIFALFNKIEGMSSDLDSLKPVLNATPNETLNISESFIKICTEQLIVCESCNVAPQLPAKFPASLMKAEDISDSSSGNQYHILRRTKRDNLQKSKDFQEYDTKITTFLEEGIDPLMWLRNFRETQTQLITELEETTSESNYDEYYDKNDYNTDTTENAYQGYTASTYEYDPSKTIINEDDTTETSKSGINITDINNIGITTDMNLDSIQTETTDSTIKYSETDFTIEPFTETTEPIDTDIITTLNKITVPNIETYTSVEPEFIDNSTDEIDTFIDTSFINVDFDNTTNDLNMKSTDESIFTTLESTEISRFNEEINTTTESINTEKTVNFDETTVENNTEYYVNDYTSTTNEGTEDSTSADYTEKSTYSDAMYQTTNKESDFTSTVKEDKLDTTVDYTTEAITETVTPYEPQTVKQDKEDISTTSLVKSSPKPIMPICKDISPKNFTTVDVCPRSFNYSSRCGSENITQVFYLLNCRVINRLCYKTICNMTKSKIDDNKNSTNITTVNIAYKGDNNRTMYNLTKATKKKLLKLCWETMFGQELVKLTMMDLVFVLLGTLFMDFFRALFVRYMNRCWCWDLEKKFPEYGDFKIAENILHLINNQGMVWMGMFFSPGLVVLNVVKLMIMMYLRSWAVMTCNVPHEVVFRVSKSNNFYLALLLTMLFLCVLPVGYTIVWVKPSWHCGPFSEYDRIYYILTTNIYKILPHSLNFALEYIASPAIVIPLLVLLILIIYYLTSLTNSLREANNDLKIQLRRERTEERRKMFQLADTRRKGGSSAMDNTPFARWKKALPSLPMSKSIDSDDRKTSTEETNEPTRIMKKKGGIFAKIVGMALDKKTDVDPVSEVDTAPNNIDDETDTEFHEGLRLDVLKIKDIKIIKPDLKKSNPSEAAKLEHRTHKIDDDNEASSAEKRTKDLKNIIKEITKPKIASEVPKIIKEGKKMNEKQTSVSSTQSKQSDSVGSIIPVITISTTESDEEMVSKSEKSTSSQKEKAVEKNVDKSLKKTYDGKSLRRQSSVESRE